MAIKKTYKISVRDLIGICLKQGSLGRGYLSSTRALDGIREHTRIQGLRPDCYKKEVPVSINLDNIKFDLKIFGRIDGIFELEDSITIEEIKTCQQLAQQMADNPSPLHMAQLKCYGHMIAQQRNLDSVFLQLTYVRIGTQTSAENKAEYTAAELKVFFDSLVKRYLQILLDQINWQRVRNDSINDIVFPYEHFRKSQRQLAEIVYKIVKNKKILFARAPTGTGKTIATLFPTLKSLGLGTIDKIFYLTAKTMGRTVALKALEDLKAVGLKLKSIVLTAKQKICFTSDDSCDMETCQYALNYYDKLSDAMSDISVYDTFDQVLVETLAQKYELCPFELSLDISLICDVIICDLNYCFDPRVYLKRYFDHGKQKVTFLIDEAHNLHDRLRSMYSAALFKTDVLKTQKLIREDSPDLSKSLVAINKLMIKMKRQCKEDHDHFFQSDEIPEDLLSEIRTFSRKADLWLDRNSEDSDIRSGLLDFFFQANVFINIAGYFDTNYKFYVQSIKGNDLIVRLFCMDPSPIFSDLIKRGHSSILFSATLSPVDFHREILFNDTIQPYSIDLPSPFPKENFGLFLHQGIKTSYRDRPRYYKKIAALICDVINSKNGNYMIYLPSYAFLNSIIELIDKNDIENNILIQYPNMTEPERQDFLDIFSSGDAVAGFVVMGGIFGEGIDLTGDHLIGAVIVSPGIPQICPERNLIKNYYDKKDHSGFYKSYQMPGFNRVMQAAGRVIRTDKDKGVVVLVGERFNRQDYRVLFPYEWEDVCVVSDTANLKINLNKFWQKQIQI